MKTAKIVFTLLLLSVFFALPIEVKAQDVVNVSVDIGSPSTWHFSFKHGAGARFSVTQFALSIDTTNSTGFPDVRFTGNNTVELPATTVNWSSGVDNNLDSAFWCCDNSAGFILPGKSDSFFAFQLQPNPNNNNANIFGYPITISWAANFAVEDKNGDPCAVVTGVSTGSFTVEDFPWTGNILDTVTANSSTPGCDPIFNFTVRNRNSSQTPIDQMIFQSGDLFSGTIRPSDIQLPNGWVVNSASTQSVSCTSTASNFDIDYGQALGDFRVGLRANPSATLFSFPWQALSGGIIVDEDTVFNVPATVQPCSTNPSSDAVIISNTTKCLFSASLENFHAASDADSISPLTTFILSTPTPGVTFTSASLPPSNIYPWIKGWADSGVTSSKLTYFANQEKYGQPGGTTGSPWNFGINNAQDAPEIIINWQTFNLGQAISSGTDTINCGITPTPDTAWLVGSPTDCEYALAVKNRHVPQSNIGAVSIGMPSADGSFTSATGPTGWQGGVSGPTALIQNKTGIPLINGSIDTFFFTTSPAKPGTTWPLTWITYVTFPTQLTDDTIKNVAGCTPTVVCDTVTETGTATSCQAILTVQNRSTTGTINRITVIPQGNWHIGIATSSIGWTDSTYGSDDSVAYFGGAISPESNKSLAVSFNHGPDTSPFPVMIRTYSDVQECISIDTMTCTSAGVKLTPNTPTQDLALTVVPNPLDNRSDISFTLGNSSEVNLMLVDILGRTQATLFNGTLPSGDHTLPLDASTLAPGTYYIRMEAEGQRMTTKIVVQR